MADSPQPEHRHLMMASAIMAGVGWPALILLFNVSLPTVGPRWFFFFLWTLAVTGTSLPFLWVLHRRFDLHRNGPASVLLRQSLLVGLFAALCAWLQVNRSLTLPLALMLGLGIAALEWFLRLIERTSWRPGR